VAETPGNHGRWVKSSFSGDSGCVEVAVGSDEVLVRQSKDPDGPFVAFDGPEWDVFVQGVKAGEFDR